MRDGSVLPITANIGVLAAIVETSLFAIGGKDIKATTRPVRTVPQLVGYTGEVEAADEKAAGTRCWVGRGVTRGVQSAITQSSDSFASCRHVGG